MTPWSFVCFRLPSWAPAQVPPEIAGSGQIYLDLEESEAEPLVETQNYGQSLLETSFSPWVDLQEAIVSLNASRKNAARIERLITANVGRLDPAKAAGYLNAIAEQMRKAGAERLQSAQRRGFFTTILNHLLPVFGDGRGNLETSVFEGDPNIDGLADIDFHVKRLCSALGIDPALVGFGEMLSGGLGDGGFFRLSIMAGIIAGSIREAVLAGLEELASIHVAYKFNKVFLDTEKPWKFEFNSISSSIEREEAENRETMMNQSSLFIQTLGMIDQEMNHADKYALIKWLWGRASGEAPEAFESIFKKDVPLPAGDDDDDDSQGDEDDYEEDF